MFGKKKVPVGKTQSTEFGRQVGDFADIIGKQAINLADKAKYYSEHYSKASKKWAGPKLDEASKRYHELAGEAGKRYHELADEAGKRYADLSSEASKRYADYSSEAVNRWEKDLLPRLQAAVEAAKSEAGKDTDLRTKITNLSSETSKALTTAPKQTKTKKFGKFVGWTTVLASAAGIGYLIWKRSQPVEDPWAEAYWENIAAEDKAAAAAQPGVAEGEHVETFEETRVAEAEAHGDTEAADIVDEHVGDVAVEDVVVEDEILDDKVEPALSEADAAHQAGIDTDKK